MVSVALGTFEQPARADVVTAAGIGSAATSNTTNGPGTAVTPMAAGAQATNYANFRRWDGVWQPYAALNLSSGNWPYRLTEASTSFTAAAGGLSFTQGKIPGAAYSYQPDRIEETIRINSSFPTVLTAPAIFVPFSTTYFPVVGGGAMTLYDYSGNVAWTTAPFAAWDAAATPDRWANAVASIQMASGGFNLVLNTTVTSTAVYPLVIDPTWIIGGSVGWGASTFVNTTTDLGDGSVKLGMFADDFNNNQATGWTTTGTVTFAGGTMTLASGSSAFHSASWTNLNVQFDVYFASYHSSVAEIVHLFLGDTSPQSSGIFLEVWQNGNWVSVYDTHTAQGCGFAATINTKTWYTPRLSAQGKTYQVYWNGVLGCTWTDTWTRPTGGIDFDTPTIPAAVSVDNVRVWNTNTGSVTTPVRNAGSSRPLQTELFGTVDAYNQTHLLIRSSPNNSTWGPWTNLKSDAATGIPYAPANQTQQQYYQLQIVFTTGVNGTASLSQITTTEGTATISPTANTGMEPWYAYVGGMVNLVSGNLYVTGSDLSFQGKGFSLGVTRSYNSLLASTAGPFGLGWTFNYGQTLVINSNGNVTWNGPDGSQFLFVAKGTTGGFDPPRGLPDRLVKNVDGSYSLCTTDGGSEKFSSAGLLQSIADKNGNVLTLAYTGHSVLLLSTVSDGAGKTLSFGYDSSHRITSVTDPAGREATYAYYGSANELEYATDPMGNRTFYGYNSLTYLNEIRDPVGKQIYVVLQSGGQVNSLWLENVTTSGNLVWDYQEYAIWYNSTTVHTVQDARGYWTTVTLNAFGNPILVRGPSLGCAACSSSGNTSSYVWDGEMNKIATTDGRGNTWLMTYGFRGNLLSTTDPGTNVSSEAWLEANNATSYFVVPASTTTFRHYTTTYAYDPKGNLLSVTDPGGNTTRYVYDASGFLNETVSARAYPTWYVYNASGWLVKREDALSETTTYTYDGLGRLTAATDPLGFVTTTAYDKDSHVTRTTDPLGNYSTYGYDARGDLVQVTDPDSGVTTYTVNVTNGKTATVMDTGRKNSTAYAYDLRGNLAATTDANQYTTTYAYDAYDRLIIVTTPLGYTTRYVYDAAGNWIARTDGNGYTTKYAYDKSERLAATMYPGPPVYASPQTLTYTYDADGNLVKTIGFGYTETFGFDRSDRLAWEVFNFGTTSTTTKYTFDADGNRKTMTLGTAATTYFYDKVDRLTGILDPEGQNTTYGYDKDSRQTSQKNPSGVVTTSLYDKASRLKAIYTNATGPNGPTVLESFAYGYDNAGLRTSETDVQSGVTTSTTYTYDQNHRLYKTVQGSSTTVDTYDAVGNVATDNSGSTTRTYSYDIDNELEYVLVAGKVWVSYQYDKDGNEKSSNYPQRGGGDSYTYDAENRLLSSTGGASYTYAPTGERVTSTSSSVTTDLAYDPLSGGNLLATYTSSGTQTARYLDSGGLNSPVEVYEGGNHYAYQTDALGSVRMVTGGSQNATDTYAYDAWGNPTSQSGTLANPFEYTGSLYAPDANSNGYYDDRARFYDPSADGGHRFLSQDPVGGGYAYAGDGPLNFVDPRGTDPIPTSRGDPTQGTYANGETTEAKCLISGSCAGTGELLTMPLPPPSPGPVWTDACNVALLFFAVAIGFTIVIGVMPPPWQLQAFESRAASWFIGGSHFSFGGSVSGLAGTVFSIFWYVLWNLWLPSLGFWDAAASALMLAGRANPVGVALMVAQVLIQLVFFMITLTTMNCV